MSAPAELGLAGEVVVQARLGDADLGGDVGVAEAVEAARLHQPLGDVEDAGAVALGRGRGAADLMSSIIAGGA